MVVKSVCQISISVKRFQLLSIQRGGALYMFSGDDNIDDDDDNDADDHGVEFKRNTPLTIRTSQQTSNALTNQSTTLFCKELDLNVLSTARSHLRTSSQRRHNMS